MARMTTTAGSFVDLGWESPWARWGELGKRIFEEVSKEGWQQWLKDSVRFINTYRVDLATSDGQKFMLKQCAVYFSFEEGDLAQTAWTAPTDKPAGGESGEKKE